MREPTCTRATEARYHLQGYVAGYLKGVTDQWLMPSPAANPGMLDMFGDRDRHPRRDLVPWAGEFAGKYLTSAVQVLRLTGDRDLRKHLKGFVRQLIRLQADDGYLGPWPEDNRLTGEAPNCMGSRQTWDAWGHYHVMLGLLLWHEETGDRQALLSAANIGDLFCDRFLGDCQPRLVDTGSTEMNLAPAHSLCLLYRRTDKPAYLDLARQIVEEFAAARAEGPLAGDYVRTALEGQEFYQIPKPRWESLHPIMAMSELHWLAGEERLRQAFEHIWWSIVKLDRHNNGGFTSGEQAQGNPYHQGAIETCCTIAWIAMSVEMLRLTANSIVADEIELSTLNSVVGLHSESGRWVTYNTPMDGVRKASAHEIVFQAREGTPELNCCSVNGPRGLGMISDWALMQDADGLILNWYGPGTMEARVRGVEVRLRQETKYPRQRRVRLQVRPARPTRFVLKLRIPYWSERTAVEVNGKSVNGVAAGEYLCLERKWRREDVVDLALDFRLHYWKGEQECEGKASVYRGPILMTYDRRLNPMDPEAIPELDAVGLKGKLVSHTEARGGPFVQLDVKAVTGEKLRLCDFGGAGDGGAPYQSWLNVRNAPASEYSRENPLRSGRPNGV